MEDAVQLPEHVRLSLTELHCLLHCLSLGPVALPVALPFLDPVAAAYITTDCGAAAACRCAAPPGNGPNHLGLWCRRCLPLPCATRKWP